VREEGKVRIESREYWAGPVEGKYVVDVDSSGRRYWRLAAVRILANPETGVIGRDWETVRRNRRNPREGFNVRVEDSSLNEFSYPEVVLPYAYSARDGKYPEKCPICASESDGVFRGFYLPRTYLCGGKYVYFEATFREGNDFVYGGLCPKAGKALEAGLGVSVPDGILSDARKELGLDSDETDPDKVEIKWDRPYARRYVSTDRRFVIRRRTSPPLVWILEDTSGKYGDRRFDTLREAKSLAERRLQYEVDARTRKESGR
jgi:hypothetical protein